MGKINPLVDGVGELIFHNRYSYANNNPVNLTDPAGLQPCIGDEPCLLIPGTGNDEILTRLCERVPNAFGCPGYQSPGGFNFPRNFSESIDRSIEQAWLWCQWANGGACIDLSGSEQARGARRSGPSTLPPGTVLAGRQCDENNRNDWRWRTQLHGENTDPRPGERGEVQSHHGVTDAWMDNLFGEDGYKRDEAPSVLMPTENHQATFTPLNDLMFPKNWDWDAVSWGEMYSLAQIMFDAARTPRECRREYWNRLKDYTKGLVCRMAVRLAVHSLTQLPAPSADMARWAGVEACGEIKW